MSLLGGVSLRVFFCEEFGYFRLGIPVGYTSELERDCKTVVQFPH